MLMKKFLPLTLLLTPAIGPAHEADNSAVQWNQIVGVITAPGINNPVAASTLVRVPGPSTRVTPA